MEFVLGVIVGLAIGFLWGVWRATQSFIERIIERPDDIREIMAKVEQIQRDDEEQATTDQELQPVRAEFINNVCYLYDANDQFLAQGDSATAAIQAAKKRFPDMTFAIRLNDTDKSAQ